MDVYRISQIYRTWVSQRLVFTHIKLFRSVLASFGGSETKGEGTGNLWVACMGDIWLHTRTHTQYAYIYIYNIYIIYMYVHIFIYT